jgi:hypothetical protein
MNSTTQMFHKTNKLALLFLLACSIQISAITSNMTHRVMSTSPLLYKMIDYSNNQTSYELEPIFSAAYDTAHINENIMLNGESSLLLNQQGNGDINPYWLNLISNNGAANYNSILTFTPSLRQAGVLLHWYKQFKRSFLDIKTALVQCTSEITLSEVGGDNGANTGILNAQQAFTQSDWNYGKIGESNHVAGLDNIEIRFGASGALHDQNETSYNMFFSGFGIIEAPTGSGTKAEYLFEPQVGTNHWGIGVGIEALLANNDDLKFMMGANLRYLTPGLETRSFDLTENGQWSRYLLLQYIYNLPNTPIAGVAGINLFTQSAYIQGRIEFNAYTRLAKQVGNCLFELSYNYFYEQAETIKFIETIMPGYGIYALTGPAGGGGGTTTSSLATINQDVTSLDAAPVELTTSMLNKSSGAAGAYGVNNLTARVEKVGDDFIYGCGASIEVAQSASAVSTWSVWAKFEFLFDN